MEKTYGDMIREARDALGLTQQELADDTELGVSTGTLSRWENGHLKPSIDQAVLLIEKLRLNPYAFLRALGFPLVLKREDRIEPELLRAILRLSAEDQKALAPFVQRVADAGPLPEERGTQ